ncbi:MAG: segregation/condensation protein A [Leptolyngbyaceae cyanobacterium bins.59]|nr:segregation/condensation protein A [Leptolyngbyaceae cyanobacterium bins.59]
MPQSLAQNAIALLIDLAERGEIDPWDVKVIDVIDRFLNQLRSSEGSHANRAVYELNLSESGQAFLYASMLVLLKADSLARSDSPELESDPHAEAELLDGDEPPLLQMPLHLDRQLRRRAVAQPPQQRRVTLQELIDQLKLMATAMEDQTPRTRVRRPRPQSRNQAVRVITQLAHQENLTEIALELNLLLQSQWEQMVKGEEDWLDFDALLEVWAAIEKYSELTARGSHHGEHGLDLSQKKTGERVSIFWALLFLASQSKVELSQEEFYQDLKVRTIAELQVYAIPE